MSNEPVITIGADPELFLTNKSTGEYFPVCGLIGGDKYAPTFVEDGALQEDNVMAELNIIPATTCDQFVGNINSVLGQLRAMLDKHGLVTTPLSHAEFTKQALESEQAKMFGCDPDYNIYTMDKNYFDDVELILSSNRFAGGHIHTGILNPQKDNEFLLESDPMGRVTLVKAHELFVGLPSVFIDDDKERKKYYGMAGSYRMKSYGIEYRVPSNFWLKSKAHQRWIYQATHRAARAIVRSTRWVENVFEDLNQEGVLANAINTKHRDSAMAMLNYAGIDPPPQKLWVNTEEKESV